MIYTSDEYAKITTQLFDKIDFEGKTFCKIVGYQKRNKKQEKYNLNGFPIYGQYPAREYFEKNIKNYLGYKILGDNRTHWFYNINDNKDTFYIKIENKKIKEWGF